MTLPDSSVLLLAWDEAAASVAVPSGPARPPTVPLMHQLAAQRGVLAVYPHLPPEPADQPAPADGPEAPEHGEPPPESAPTAPAVASAAPTLPAESVGAAGPGAAPAPEAADAPARQPWIADLPTPGIRPLPGPAAAGGPAPHQESYIIGLNELPPADTVHWRAALGLAADGLQPRSVRSQWPATGPDAWPGGRPQAPAAPYAGAATPAHWPDAPATPVAGAAPAFPQPLPASRPHPGATSGLAEAVPPLPAPASGPTEQPDAASDQDASTRQPRLSQPTRQPAAEQQPEAVSPATAPSAPSVPLLASDLDDAALRWTAVPEAVGAAASGPLGAMAYPVPEAEVPVAAPLPAPAPNSARVAPLVAEAGPSAAAMPPVVPAASAEEPDEQDNGESANDAKEAPGQTQQQLNETQLFLNQAQQLLDQTQQLLHQTQQLLDQTQERLDQTQERLDQPRKRLNDTQEGHLPTALPALRLLPPTLDGLNGRIIDYARRALQLVEGRRDFGVIYAPNWPTWLAALEIRNRSGCPLVVYVTGLAADVAPTERGLLLEIERMTLRRAHLILVPDAAVRRQLETLYRNTIGEVRVVAADDDEAVQRVLNAVAAERQAVELRR